MGHCIAAADRFTPIPDPYGKGRNCFEITHTLLERSNMVEIIKDSAFLFIYNNVVYFNA